MTSQQGSTELPALRSTRLVLRAGLASVFLGMLILAAKFVAALVTGSTALLADAAESVVNVVAAAMATYSVAVAAKPADEDHPYGHGKAEFLSAATEGLLIVIAATVIIVAAVNKIVVGPELARLDLGIVVAVLAAAANLILGLYVTRVGRREESQAMEADGLHILTDVGMTVGILIGLVAVRFTGLQLLDPIMALLVAAYIAATGYRVVRRALSGLLDEEDPELLSRIASHLESVRRPEWIDFHQVRTRRSGTLRHIELHFVVPRYFTIDEAHQLGDSVEASLLERLGRPVDVVVHVDPCTPRQCEGCTVESCSVRSAPPEKCFSFDPEALTKRGTI